MSIFSKQSLKIGTLLVSVFSLLPAFAGTGVPLNPRMSYSIETETFAMIERAQKSGMKLVSVRISPEKTFYISFNSLGDLNSAWFYVNSDETPKNITKKEQKELKLWMEENSEELEDASTDVMNTLGFLTEFMPANEIMEDYQAPILELLSKAEISAREPKFLMICEDIGKSRNAVFTRKTNTVEAVLIVGTKATNCRGRCGTGCEQPGQSMKNQYTQECLNHDACSDAAGAIFGDCSDEFWTASSGYMNAPDCESGPL